MISGFFRENILIVSVIYTLLFFLLGFAIALKLNRKSELKLARALWLLSGYGFALGIAQLLSIIMLVKESALSPHVLYVMVSSELALKAFAFMLLLWLGIRLIIEYYPQLRSLYWVGLGMSIAWTLAALYTVGFHHDQLYIGLMDNLSRYMFAFPGLYLAGSGLLLHIKEVQQFKIPSLVKHVKGLAYTFFAGVILVGMVANYPVFWPAVVLNRESFVEIVGIPINLFRSLYLVFLTYFVIRIVDVFEVERDARLEEALRRQVLSEERDRIARELHDGIIQSIYGVGLKLDQYALLREKRPADAGRHLKLAKIDLNTVIQDIRDYIEDLHVEDYDCVSLKDAVLQLVEEFREHAMMQVHFASSGKQVGDISIVQINHILQIVRELFTNATKHSRASNIWLNLIFGEQDLVIRLSDDGLGFDREVLQSEKHPGEKQGLNNIFHRIVLLQGTMVFHTSPGKGTKFEITLPYKKLSYIENAYIEDPEYFRKEIPTGD
jgi:signal transduction histidine kinase